MMKEMLLLCFQIQNEICYGFYSLFLYSLGSLSCFQRENNTSASTDRFHGKDISCFFKYKPDTKGWTIFVCKKNYGEKKV